MSDDAENPPSPEVADLAPALTLLRALHGEGVPDGPLGPDTVPARVLALPVKAAIGLFDYHGKVCSNLHCQHLPPPLRRYRRMRPQAIQGAADEVHDVLWSYPDHDLVITVREAILDEYQELSGLVSEGSLLEGERLGELVKDREGVCNLAAVLWASRFQAPHAEELFRCLVPVAAVVDSADGDPGTPGGPRDRESLKKLKAGRRKLQRQLKEAGEEAGKLRTALRRRELALEEARREHRTSRERAEAASAEVEGLQDRLAEIHSAVGDYERRADRTEKVNSDLLQDRRRLQEEILRKDQERSRLAARLANENTRVRRLEQQAAGRPRGADAVWRFLRREKERIQADRTGTSGDPGRAEGEWAAHRRLEEAFLAAYPRFRRRRPVVLPRPKPPLRLVALGGSSEIGRSCYLLELGDRRILVDCGIKASAWRDLHPGCAALDRIDALLLTHAHADHIGWVPALVRRFGDGLEIYCSSGTAALLPVQLQDGRQHYLHKMRLRRDNAQYGSEEEGPRDAYGQEDVDLVPYLVCACGFGEETGLPFDDVSVRFFPAGHILGAASILIESRGRRIFFSGDFSSFPQLTTPAASWPEDLGEIDLLVLESTYGNRRHRPMEQVRGDLLAFIRETTQTRGGSVILASFALGRAQELLKLIAAAQDRGELPPSLPVHFDGMIREINPIYADHADFRLAGTFREVSGPWARQEVAEQARTVPSVIVTTSGMLTGGPVIEYARRLLPDPRHRIVLTGYQDEGAPSRALRSLASSGPARRIRLSNGSGEAVEIQAALPAKEVGLSAHADQPGLVSYAGRLRPRHIALVHGEPAAQVELGARLGEGHPGAEIVCGPDELEVP